MQVYSNLVSTNIPNGSAVKVVCIAVDANNNLFSYDQNLTVTAAPVIEMSAGDIIFKTVYFNIGFYCWLMKLLINNWYFIFFIPNNYLLFSSTRFLKVYPARRCYLVCRH